MTAAWTLRRLQLELVNVCNYRCPLCRTLEQDGVARRRMTPAELERLLAGAPPLETVALYGTRGEPYLHPELEAMAARVREVSGAAVELSTNGSLVDEERAARTLAAGVGRVIFAVDGLTQESYAAYRRGGDLSRVLRNLEALCRLRDAGGYATRVVFQLIPMAGNEAELERVAEVAYGLGVDQARLKVSSSVARSRAHRPRDARYSAGGGAEAAGFACPFGLDKLYVDPSGDAFPCCYAEGRPALRLGNALQTPLRELWREDLARAIRRSFDRGRGHHPFCVETCSSRPARRKLKLARPVPG